MLALINPPVLALPNISKPFQVRFLHGTPFQLITDHRPLVRMPDKDDLTCRQARDVTCLSDFRYTMVYEPCKGNVADPLSRHPSLAAITRHQAKQQAAGQPSTSAPPPAPVRTPHSTPPPLYI
jgi:hypothetical protein